VNKQKALLLIALVLVAATAFWVSSTEVSSVAASEVSIDPLPVPRKAEPLVALAPGVGSPSAQQAAVPAAQAITSNTPLSDKSTVGKAYRYFQTQQYVAAMQLFEAARFENEESIAFFGDLLTFCSPKITDQAMLDRWLRYLRSKPTPTTENKVWIAIKSYEICRNYQSPALSEQDLSAFSTLRDRKAAEIGPMPAAALVRAWKDEWVVRAQTVEQLWGLASGSFAGAVGAEYFGVVPTRRSNDSQSVASLSLAQTVAIMRLRCDLTHACGSEQLDSLLVCARYFQCRPGISVEEVWRSVASPYELQAAQAIYEQYVALRAVRDS
jgi:hypothetical protein